MQQHPDPSSLQAAVTLQAFDNTTALAAAVAPLPAVAPTAAPTIAYTPAVATAASPVPTLSLQCAAAEAMSPQGRLDCALRHAEEASRHITTSQSVGGAGVTGAGRARGPRWMARRGV